MRDLIMWNLITLDGFFVARSASGRRTPGCRAAGIDQGRELVRG